MKTLQAIAAALTLCLVSCKTTPTKKDDGPIQSPIPTIQSLGTNIDQRANSIQNEAVTVKENGVQLEDNLREIQGDLEPTRAEIVTDSIVLANQVQVAADHIIETTKQIKNDTTALDEVAVTIRDLEAKAAALHEAEQKAKEEALKRLYAFIATFWVIGFVVVVGGIVVAFFVNRTMGFTISMVGASMVGFAAASQFYMKEIAQFGAFLLVGMIVFGMVILVRSMFNAERNSTAVKEIVEMIDILKETMTDDEKARIFGPEGVASKVQSDLTKQIVAKTRDQS